MTYLTEYITPLPHLIGPRVGHVVGVIIHSTRGGSASLATDYLATKNWFRNPNNRAPGTDYGGCSNRIIGPKGEHCIVMDDDHIPRYSAGYGGVGAPVEFLVDNYYISYEVAQNNASTPYTEEQYDRLAIEVANDIRKHGFPAQMVDLRGNGQRWPVKPGITRHDRTANGQKLGKSDPGNLFDEARFLSKLHAYLNEEGEELNDQDKQWVAAEIRKALGEIDFRQLNKEAIDTFVRGAVDEQTQRLAKESTVRAVQTAIDKLTLSNGG